MFFSRLRRDIRALTWAAQCLDESLDHNSKRMDKLMKALDRLATDVANMTRVATSATALLTGLSAQIRNAAGDEAKANKLADDIEASAADLANAVLAGTPTEGELPDPTADQGGAATTSDQTILADQPTEDTAGQ